MADCSRLNMPRFSIIITSYNTAAFIGEAADSALAQEFPDKEIIIVDDASTDGSVEILKQYGETIRLIALESNGGAAAARNRGAALASGDYLVFLDGDDRLLPWALDVFDRIVDKKDPKLILCDMLYFRELFSTVKMGTRPLEIRVVDYESFMKKDRMYRASASAMVIDRQIYREVGGFSLDIWQMGDADLMLKLGNSGRTISIVSPPTSAYRLHANNSSLQILGLIDGVHTMIRKENSNQYPGGRALKAERYAVLGGIVFSWLKKSFRKRLYREFLKLLAAGWPMVSTAIVYRGIAIVRGRRPVEILQIPNAKAND